MYGENDATKVITIRISEAEYDNLQKVVKQHEREWYPRVTTSYMVRKMIEYCLIKGIDPCKKKPG